MYVYMYVDIDKIVYGQATKSTDTEGGVVVYHE